MKTLAIIFGVAFSLLLSWMFFAPPVIFWSLMALGGFFLAYFAMIGVQDLVNNDDRFRYIAIVAAVVVATIATYLINNNSYFTPWVFWLWFLVIWGICGTFIVGCYLPSVGKFIDDLVKAVPYPTANGPANVYCVFVALLLVSAICYFINIAETAKFQFPQTEIGTLAYRLENGQATKDVSQGVRDYMDESGISARFTAADQYILAPAQPKPTVAVAEEDALTYDKFGAWVMLLLSHLPVGFVYLIVSRSDGVSGFFKGIAGLVKKEADTSGSASTKGKGKTESVAAAVVGSGGSGESFLKMLFAEAGGKWLVSGLKK